jgi:murein DD-endopeptidase MepM/ murein hydrolase activator NlpD
MARFFLDQRKVVRGGGFMDPMYYQYWRRHHYGTDYVANFVNGYAPKDGRITRKYFGGAGGNWLELTLDDGYSFRLCHLSRYHRNAGIFKEGDLLFTTGNSGSHTSGPHLHCQCNNPKGKIINSEDYFNSILTSHPMDHENNVIRLADDGSYAYVKGGKKQLIKDPGALAVFTFLQRIDNPINKFINNVDKETWEKYPITEHNFFPQ